MNSIPHPSHPSQHSVMLPCSPEDFSNFIGGLLGKPQTISRNLYGAFEIDREGIVNIHHLLNQRILQQNEGDLIQFTAKIIFSDNSSVLLNSLEDLINYNEVRPIISQQLHLSWMYIIKFKGRSFPEKQSIDLSFLTNGEDIYFDETSLLPHWRKNNPANVAYRIQHTARTWGADIQALLDNHLRSLLIFEGHTKKFCRKHYSKMQISIFVGLFLAAFVTVYNSGVSIIKARSDSALILMKNGISIDAKLNGLISIIQSDPWQRFLMTSIGYIIFSLIVSIIFSMWMESSIDAKKPSFVLLSSMSDKYKDKRMSEYNKKWLSFVGSVLFSIITGVISCIIFASYWPNQA